MLKNSGQLCYLHYMQNLTKKSTNVIKIFYKMRRKLLKNSSFLRIKCKKLVKKYSLGIIAPRNSIIPLPRKILPHLWFIQSIMPRLLLFLFALRMNYEWIKKRRAIMQLNRIKFNIN